MTRKLSTVKDDLFGAYVHGSLGNHEETGYSDFDALVIIKDNVFHSRHRLAALATKLGAMRCYQPYTFKQRTGRTVIRNRASIWHVATSMRTYSGKIGIMRFRITERG